MRILLAEDDLITRKLVQANLVRWGHEVVVCSDGAEAWKVLQGDDPPKLVVVDWMMPEMDGISLCREIRKDGKRPYTYIILLTAKNKKEDVVEGLEAGADDYVIKPFDTHELRVRVRAGSRIVRLQEDLMAALAASEFQATHDTLTGLWNRRAILEILQKELDRSRRETAPLGLVMLDLDHFKQVNDSYGHQAGDAVLGDVARMMTSSLRSYDSAGRYGGEEFIMVLPGCNAQDSKVIAERLRLLATATPIETSGGVLSVTISLGVAATDGSGHCEASSLIREADEALYSAKRQGRNRVEVWEGGA
ncbi:MAG: diguanylate cyclase [Desulfomonile tiedjei]|nr:diguanylate cyclase [Desulfomonile tiedjei]